MRMKWLLLPLFLLFAASPSFAQCTGGGTTWACPSGTTPAQVNAALNSATDGATLTFANGTYTWGGTIIDYFNTKGATLICAMGSTCTVNVSSGTAVGMGQFATGTNTKLYRFSGFTVNYAGNNFLIWAPHSNSCGSGGSPCVMTNWRIDHNNFVFSNGGGGGVVFAAADTGSVFYLYGVMDHNVFTSPSSAQLFYDAGATNSAPAASAIGTINNFFVEDNTITITTMTNAGQSCMDSWGGARIVWRHNSETNCLGASHGVTHAGGPDNFEVYNNNLIVNAGSVSAGVGDGYRLFHHQGSNEMMVFNNVLTAFSGHSGAALDLLHYRDYGPPPSPNGSIDGLVAFCDGTQGIDGNRTPTATYRGYPCWRQPGRDPANGHYMPIYVWNNYWSDDNSQVLLNVGDGSYGSPDYFAQHMVANRDWFNSVSAMAQTSATSPFNGTTGMGFGTLARRPTTCTTSTETAFGAGAGGVGYFATDSGAQGTLYTCSATNTWSVYYQPFTYPYPGSGGGGSPAVSLSPGPIAFADQVTGTTSLGSTETLTNTGTATLNISSITLLTGTQYAISGNTCSSTLGAGSNCIVTLTFTPTTNGLKSDTLRFATDAASTPDDAAISGTGVSAPTPLGSMNGTIKILGSGQIK